MIIQEGYVQALYYPFQIPPNHSTRNQSRPQ
ncbi:hypothetical protein [Clostridium phage Villandry]|nr:hypothetical protein [Clostridium phage Villandry]